MMIERAKTEDFGQLKELWQVVFDEDPSFLEHFFAVRFSPEHIFVAWEDGRIVSALHALPSHYTQNGKTFPCSYIVGAATYKEYRKRGIMGKLLAATSEAYDHPITLFPAVRPFYEANGYITTSGLRSYDLNDFTGPLHASVSLAKSQLNAIFSAATEQAGALGRDDLAWDSLIEGYGMLAVEDAYALIKDGIAVEAMAMGEEAAFALLCLLSEKNIQKVQVLPDSVFTRWLVDQPFAPVPMGMSTSAAMRGVYIAEQY